MVRVVPVGDTLGMRQLSEYLSRCVGAMGQGDAGKRANSPLKCARGINYLNAQTFDSRPLRRA